MPTSTIAPKIQFLLLWLTLFHLLRPEAILGCLRTWQLDFARFFISSEGSSFTSSKRKISSFVTGLSSRSILAALGLGLSCHFDLVRNPWSSAGYRLDLRGAVRLLWLVVWLGGVILWIIGIIKAFQGQKWEYPFISEQGKKYFRICRSPWTGSVRAAARDADTPYVKTPMCSLPGAAVRTEPRSSELAISARPADLTALTIGSTNSWIR